MNQPRPENVRVVTTIGHVDHGKTTFVDSLLAANNIISTRLAGKIRYMDSREDEQQRGITMESSAVSLHFKIMPKGADDDSVADDYVVNLIDTPGHVDFSSEVSIAARLCDGALVLVDVVEGVCTQTVTVLRQAWLDSLKPILIINKFDRLIIELKLTPAEAYQHLTQLIEAVNAVMGSFFAGERLEDDLRWREAREARLAARRTTETEGDANADEDNSLSFAEKDDEDLYFSPERGNVIFACALDGWGFRTGRFAQLYAAKLGVREARLRRVLWGDFFLDPKTKRVVGPSQLRGRALKPLFVQFVLDNIWAVYDAVLLQPNAEKTAKIITTLGLNILPRDLKAKDQRVLLATIFSKWLPLATCTVQAVADVVPPPTVAQRTRVPRMLHPETHDPAPPATKLEQDLYACNAGPTAQVVAYVSKMFAVPRKELPANKRKPVTADELRLRPRQAREMQSPENPIIGADAANLAECRQQDSALEDDAEAAMEDAESDEVLLGFARLYSGTIRPGQHLACVLPKHRGAPGDEKHVVSARVRTLYTMMGRELVPVPEVRAGNVFAIGGLAGKVWRAATLCSPGEASPEQVELVNLGGVLRQSPPIVRVALEPAEPADMPKLVRGLQLLAQADPCVETFQQQTGEHVILTAGELHLERCLKDLRERFAKVEIQASEPIVPFRETAVRAADMPPAKAGVGVPRGTVCGTCFNGLISFRVRVVPLPESVERFLRAKLSDLHEGDDPDTDFKSDPSESGMLGGSMTTLAEPDELGALGKAAGAEWSSLASGLWALGPHRAGPNVLIDRREGSRRSYWTAAVAKGMLGEFETSVEMGFQVATFQGPLCAEPMQGMAVFVEALTFDEAEVVAEAGQTRMAQATGSVIAAVKDACRTGLLDWSPRLMLAMYTCEIQVATDALGKMYGVLARRRGRIISEEIKEGTHYFTVKALLPVVESFGFAEDIRKKTSGAASPQLVFSGYERLDEDPFWVPTTEEELADLGEKADKANIARGYMDGVRARKGLFVERKIVEFAEKQRTLKR